MQDRYSYTSENIFRKAMVYIPKHYINEKRCIEQLMEGHGLQQFASLTPSEQRQIENAADIIRQALLVQLKKNPDAVTSEKYTIIYDALRLLAYCFPRNKLSEENMQYMECPVTLLPLKNKTSYFVAADGYWFSLMGLLQILQTHQGDPENLINPFTTEQFLQEDINRIQHIEQAYAQDVANMKLPAFLKYAPLHLPFITIGGALGKMLQECVTTEKPSTNPAPLDPKNPSNTFGMITGALLFFMLTMLIRYKYHQSRLTDFNTAAVLDYDHPEKKRFFYSLSPLTTRLPHKPNPMDSLQSMGYALKQRLFSPHLEEKKAIPVTHQETERKHEQQRRGGRRK